MDSRKLVKSCLNGDSAAQRQLYQSYAPQMLGVCYRYTKSMSDAEDVLQEGFIKVFKNLRQYAGEGELGCLDSPDNGQYGYQLSKRESRYQYDLAFLDSALHPVSTDDPQLLLNAKELADLIRQLPPGYQMIFNLHAVEGYSHVEIGKMLGINEGTSRSQYARARGLLINWIKRGSLDNKTEFYART